MMSYHFKSEIFLLFSIFFVLLLSFLIFVLKNKILSFNTYYNDNDFKDENYQNFESMENYEDKMDSSLIYERDRQNELKEKLMTSLGSTDLSGLNKEIIQKIDLWKNNTYPYLGIERFSIPMISSVSAGKTSSLNYILNLKDNLLQTGESITTKFCIIIRHNKNNKKGKIFNVTVEKRGEINKFNFVKQEEIKEDPKKFIEERNELIKNYKKNEKDLGLYFIILEIDTGLFEGEYEKYAGLIEFIDMPGLDEKGLEDNFYFRNILPFIKPNILFPIIILDALKFESSNIFKALSEAFNPYLSKNINKNKKIQYDLEIQNYALNISKNNSLFIMNKLNLCLKQEKHNIMNRIITVASERLNVSLEFNKNIFIINALAKSLEVNKYQSFLNYINYTINKEESKEDTEILNILLEEFQKDFQFNRQINLNEKKNYKSSGSKKEYEIFDKMIKDKNLRKGKFSEKYFYYFSNAFVYFKNKKLSSLKFDSDGIAIKNAIKNKIKTLLNEFLDQKSLNQIFKLLKIDINDLEKELILKSSKKVINNPMDLIKALHNKILKLKELENGNEGINELNNDFIDLINFMDNNQFLHYLMSGPYSSGKSFTLNNIIGYNLYLLETGTAETTNHAFIIRYNKNISLYKAKLVKTKYQFFFEKGEKLAEGENFVRKKISEENHNTKEFSIYILETPIEIFEDIKINEELKNKVEFIDFPGLNTEKATKLNYINNQILKIINGFFFLNEPKDIGTNDVDDLFKIIMKKLVLDDSNIYNLKNSLILFTKNKKDGHNEFYNKDLIETINENLIQSLKDDLELIDIEMIKTKLNHSRMNYAKFSNIDYKNYMDFKNKIKTFKDFINYIINTVYSPSSDIKSLFEDIDIFIKEKFDVEKKQNTIINIIFSFFKSDSQQKKKYDDITLNNYNNYIEDFIQIINDKNLKGKKFSLGLNEKYKILDYVKRYLYIKDNIKNITDYNKSFYEDFKLKFKEIIVSSYDTINRIFNEYLFENVIKTISVIQIINTKFLMNEEEFKKIYNENENERYIKNLEEHYKTQCSSKNAKIITLGHLIDEQIEKIKNAEKKKPKIFKKEFEDIKKDIDNIFANKYYEILEVYNTIKDYIFASIQELNLFKKNRNKFDITVKNKIFEKKTFKDEVSLIIYNFFKNMFHNYEKDIENVKNRYIDLIQSYRNDIEKDTNNIFEELINNGKKTIDLIFKTAISNFNNLKKNREKYRELLKEIENLIIMNLN